MQKENPNRTFEKRTDTKSESPNLATIDLGELKAMLKRSDNNLKRLNCNLSLDSSIISNWEFQRPKRQLRIPLKSAKSKKHKNKKKLRSQRLENPYADSYGAKIRPLSQDCKIRHRRQPSIGSKYKKLN